MTKEVNKLRTMGCLTPCQVARELGIGATTLLRLEEKVYEAVPRRGKKKVCMYTPAQVGAIRTCLQDHTRLGDKPKLLTLEQVARRLGMSHATLRHYLGSELPQRKKIARGWNGKWAFDPEQVGVIVEWACRRRGGRRLAAHLCRRDDTTKSP